MSAPPKRAAHRYTVNEQPTETAEQRAQAVRAQADEQLAASQKFIADTRAQEEQARNQATERRCKASRPERAAKLREEVQAWTDYLVHLQPHAATIRKVCKAKDTRGLRVEREGQSLVIRDAGGHQSDIVCSGPLPKGVTKEQAWFVLYQGEDLNDVSAPVSGVIGAGGECLELDRAVGFDPEVKRNDVDGMKRVLAWKPAD